MITIQDIINKCKNKKSSEWFDIISQCLQTINFSKLNLDKDMIVTQKSLFGEPNMCVATSLYASFHKYIKLTPKEFVIEINTLRDRNNIPLCIETIKKYATIPNFDLKTYGYKKNTYDSTKDTFINIVKTSIDKGESCVIHMQDDLSGTSHNISIYGYDSKYLYFIENGYDNVTLKCLSIKYMLIEIVKYNNGLQHNSELINNLPNEFYKMTPMELLKYTEKYLLNHNVNTIKQRILIDIITDMSDVVSVIFNSSIGNFEQNINYSIGVWNPPNISLYDLLMGIRYK